MQQGPCLAETTEALVVAEMIEALAETTEGLTETTEALAVDD